MNRKRIFNVVLLLLIFVALFVGYTVFQQKKQEMLEATLYGLDMGKRVGKIVTTGQCIQGLTLNYSKCDNHVCSISAHGFITGCMQTAKNDNYCQSVPLPSESKKSLTWASETCNGNKLGGKCEDFITKVLDVCLKINTGKKREKTEVFIDAFKRGYEKSQ